jgi:endonuclease YncB( thermonuclease family)
VLKVIDGDTIQVEAPFLPKPLKPILSLRIKGIDTPEKGHLSKCTRENDLALRATEYTKTTLNSSQVTIIVTEWDKYGGRILGDILVNEKPLSTLLIDNGFARKYNGEKKGSWCE